MSRADLMKQIAQLDREINEASANTRLPSLSGKHAHFPTPAWVGALVILGLWAFGGMLPIAGDYIREYGLIVLGLAILTGLFAAYQTLMWLLKGRAKPDAKYHKATEKIRELQARRKALQEQLAKEA